MVRMIMELATVKNTVLH